MLAGKLDRPDAGERRDTRMEVVAEREVGRARVVVHAQRYRELGRHVGVQPVDLILGERLIGDRREQHRRRAGGLGIVRVRDDVFGTHGADADHHRHAAGRADRQPRHTDPLVAAEIRIAAGAAERPDRVGTRLGEA